MRTLSGMNFATAEMAMLESTRTKRVASPILIPLIAEEVVARVGHIPRRSTKVGLSFRMPLTMYFSLLIF